MPIPTLKRYMAIFVLFDTYRKPKVRKSILNSVRGFVSNLKTIQKAEISLKANSISVSHENYWLNFDSEKAFSVYIGSEGEKHHDLVNEIFNEVCSKLNDTKLPKEIKTIFFHAVCEFEFPKISNLISNLFCDEYLQKLVCEEDSIIPTSVELSCLKDKKLRTSYSILNKKKQKTVEIKLYDKYQNTFPLNTVKDSLQTLKKRSDQLHKNIKGGN